MLHQHAATWKPLPRLKKQLATKTNLRLYCFEGAKGLSDTGLLCKCWELGGDDSFVPVNFLEVLQKHPQLKDAASWLIYFCRSGGEKDALHVGTFGIRFLLDSFCPFFIFFQQVQVVFQTPKEKAFKKSGAGSSTFDLNSPKEHICTHCMQMPNHRKI